MAQHITRKELKQDRVAETLVHGVEAVESHQKQIWLMGIAVLVVALAVVGWRFYSERQSVKANAAFGDAMKTFEARIRAAGEPEEPGETTYVEEKYKYGDAAKKFTDVANNYSLTRPGKVARYYAGLCQERLGNYAEANKWLRQVADSSDEELSALARFELAGIAASTGKDEEAIKLYKALIDKPTLFRPKQFTMLALANVYSRKNPAEAVKLYIQLKAEFPDTGVAEEADQHLAELKPKS